MTKSDKNETQFYELRGLLVSEFMGTPMEMLTNDYPYSFSHLLNISQTLSLFLVFL